MVNLCLVTFNQCQRGNINNWSFSKKADLVKKQCRLDKGEENRPWVK